MIDESIIIVGGGWAGLSCAVELSLVGHKVTLLESARQLGGRARRIAFNEQAVDNGQHVLIGAYHETLSLLMRLDVDPDTTLERQLLDLHLQVIRANHFRLRLPHLPSPFNLLFGLLGAKGFSIKDRWSALRFGLRLYSNTISLGEDISVAQLLKNHRQTKNAIKALWEPICLASLNTPIDEASAKIFVRVLHDTFCQSSHDADLIVPKVDLGTLLPDPAFDFIEQHGGTVQLSQRVTELKIEQRHVTGVVCESREYNAKHVVLAIPPHACQPLLKTYPALHDVAYNLAGFSYHPICTIYLQFPKTVKADRSVQALLNSTGQWIIDRRISGQHGLFAVVISGPGPHMQIDNDTLIGKIKSEISDLYPHWPAPDDAIVIREKRATFNCRTNINYIRPENKTQVDGLWFAGDFTNTGYPATIEGAVQSGIKAAKQIHQEVVTQND